MFFPFSYPMMFPNQNQNNNMTMPMMPIPMPQMQGGEKQTGQPYIAYVPMIFYDQGNMPKDMNLQNMQYPMCPYAVPFTQQMQNQGTHK